MSCEELRFIEFIMYIYIFFLSIFLGVELITKVPPLLHTPLMSGSNAISGITMVGALFSSGSDVTVSIIFGTIALLCATINVVGGFLVTDRMLNMFKESKKTSGKG